MRNIHFRAAALACVLAATAMSQTSPRGRAVSAQAGNPDMGKAAAKALQDFQGLLEPEASQMVGVAAAGSASGKSLGSPKRDYFIRLDALRQFKEGDNVEKLLVDSKQMVYPVLQNQQVVGNITLVQDGAGWSMASIGDSELSHKRQVAINTSSKRFAKAESDHFLVRVPALGLEFTAFRNAKKELQLASVVDHADAGLTAGEAEPASRVLPRLVPVAIKYRGLEPPKQ